MKRKMNIALALLAALAMIMTMSISVFAGSVSRDEALKIALKNAKLSKSQVKLADVDRAEDGNNYEVEFIKKKNGTKYDYEISSESGRVIEKSVEYKYKRNSSHKKIGKTAARKKVAKFSGISYKTIKAGTCYYEYDDGKGTYEIKFTKGNRRYDYEVLAPTGKIIEYEWELINR